MSIEAEKEAGKETDIYIDAESIRVPQLVYVTAHSHQVLSHLEV